MAAPDRFSTAEDWFHRAAENMTGLEDFGAPDYREGLSVLLRSLDRHTRFAPMGREFAAGTILSTLCARLRTQEGWKRYPGCLDEPILRPLVITGIPRTGTTVLHKLLSIDPQFQGLEHWLADSPRPRPPRQEWQSNSQYQETVTGLEAFYCAVPEMRAAHEMTAHDVDECLEVLKHCFVSNRFASGWYVPDYTAWLRNQDERASYRRYADVLRLIGAGDSRRWLLKNPGHIAQLDVLLEIFPDARVVQTHRDPVKALPSLSSVLAMSRKLLEGDAVRLPEIGPRECEYWSDAVRHAAQVRSTASTRQFFDVDHRRFHSEPLKVVAELYEYFDLELAPPVEADMQRWLAANPANRLGEHRYQAEDFGLSAAAIRDTFSGYIEQFGL